MFSAKRSTTTSRMRRFGVFRPFWVCLILAVAIASGMLVGKTQPSEPSSNVSEFKPLPGIYEPSGVEQLADGRFIVVEDEHTQPISSFAVDAKGEMVVHPLYRTSLLNWFGAGHALGKLEDLEAIAVGKNDYVYGMTSHSRTKGRRASRHSREKLVRFRVEGQQLVDAEVYAGLKAHFVDRHAAVQQAATSLHIRKVGVKKSLLMVEGLTFDEAKDRLLVGFRSPLIQGKALVLTIENPAALFDLGEAPRLSPETIILDLDGGGIRALAYDPHLKGYLIVSRAESARKKKRPFRLWFWDGAQDSPPRPLSVQGTDTLRHAEGIAPARWAGRKGVVIVSDEGKATTDEPAKYLFLEYTQLMPES